MSKVTLASCVTALSLSVFGFQALAQSKVGYVDLQKAIQETSTGKKAKADLQKDFDKRQKELEKKQADLKKMGEDLEKKGMVLSDDVRARKQGEFQQEIMKYREEFEKNRMEMQKKESELTVPIVKKLRDVIEDIAKEGKYTMIIERGLPNVQQVVLWADKDSDLTDAVIKAYEKKK